MIDANGLVSPDTPDMTDVTTNEMGNPLSGAGWVDVYQRDEYIGHVWVQNVPTTRWFAVDTRDEYIGTDYQTRSEAITEVVRSHEFFQV